jgi:hypothetical protein
VHTERPLDVALDGEIVANLPGDVEVAGEALRVITPSLRGRRRLIPARVGRPFRPIRTPNVTWLERHSGMLLRSLRLIGLWLACQASSLLASLVVITGPGGCHGVW